MQSRQVLKNQPRTIKVKIKSSMKTKFKYVVEKLFVNLKLTLEVLLYISLKKNSGYFVFRSDDYCQYALITFPGN